MEYYKPENISLSLGKFPGPIRKICASPDGKHALVSINHKNKIKLYIMSYLKKEIRVNLNYDGCDDNFAYSPDGSRIITAVTANEFFNMITLVLDESRRKVKKSRPVPFLDGTITSFAYSPNGKYIAATNNKNKNGIYVFNNDSEKKVGDVFDEHKNTIKFISFSPDSKLIISVDTHGIVMIWDIQTKKKYFNMNTGGHFQCFAMDPNGKMFAWGSKNKDVNIFKFKSLTEIDDGDHQKHILNKRPYNVKSIAFSPNGNLLACGGDQDAIYIVNTKTLELYKAISSYGTVSLAFTQDSKSLITGNNNMAKIWYLEKNDASFLFDTVKKNKVKPYDIISLKFKTPSLNEKNTYDMVFQLDDFSITISIEDLINVISNTSNIKYPCKSHVPYNRLNIRDGDYVKEPYLSIRTMGFVHDGLVPLRHIERAIYRYESYYGVKVGGASKTKTTRRKKCPDGSTRDKKTGKCVDEVTKQEVDSLTNTITKMNNNGKKSVKKKDFSPIEYKRNFDHALVFSLEESSKMVQRVVSKQVLTDGDVISADHCQSDLNFQVYTIKEISNKRNYSKGKRTRSLTSKMRDKSLGRTKRNRNTSI